MKSCLNEFTGGSVVSILFLKVKPPLKPVPLLPLLASGLSLKWSTPPFGVHIVPFITTVGHLMDTDTSNQGKANDPPMNMVTAKLGKLIHWNDGFCHVEVTAPNKNGSYTSSSIYQGKLLLVPAGA